MSAVDDLNDNCFVLATEMIAELAEAFEDEIERKPTIRELCEILTEGIRGCATDILQDINVENLTALTPKVTKRPKITLTPGDILAIPASETDCYLAVYLGLYRMSGECIGLLAGRHPCGPLASDFAPVPLPRPIFFDKRAVTSGRWTILAQRPDWRTLFPAAPDYYYAPDHYRDEDGIGPFGSAEAAHTFAEPPGASSPLRHLSEAEAREIGLLAPEFFQSGNAEQVEAYLHHTLDPPPSGAT